MLQVIQKTSIHHLDEIFFLANTVLDPKVASCEFDFEDFSKVLRVSWEIVHKTNQKRIFTGHYS